MGGDRLRRQPIHPQTFLEHAQDQPGQLLARRVDCIHRRHSRARSVRIYSATHA